MSEPSSITVEETATLRAGLAEGKQPTVWFTSAAVGVEAGRSGKVTALNEPAEGDFIQVRPTGSKDVLSFEAAEITVVRPPRQKKTAAAEVKQVTPQRAAVTVTPSPTALGEPAWPGSAAAGSEVDETAPAASAGTGGTPGQDTPDGSDGVTAAGNGASAPTAGSSGAASAAGSSGTRRTATTKRAGAARAARPVEMIVTLASTLEGEWTVDVLSGKKRIAKAMPLSASVVAKVAKILPPDVEDAIDSALDAAREQQRSRVDQLQVELADAKRTLDELFG